MPNLTHVHLFVILFRKSIETEIFYFELSCFPTIVVIVAKPLSTIEKATAAMVAMHTTGMLKRHSINCMMGETNAEDRMNDVT
jgi:hypothetical protein